MQVQKFSGFFHPHISVNKLDDQHLLQSVNITLYLVCMLDNFACLVLSSGWFNIFKKLFHEYHKSIKGLGSRSGPMFCQSWSGTKLFCKCYFRGPQKPSVRKQLTPSKITYFFSITMSVEAKLLNKDLIYSIAQVLNESAKKIRPETFLAWDELHA